MRKILLTAAAILATSTAARADDYIRDDCRAAASSSGLRFENPEQARWYKRFWTGDCDNLNFCFSGAPNWNDIVGKLVIRAGPSRKAALLPKACRLGQLIGMEWSRDRRIKHIHTGDLRAFGKTLDSSDDVLRGVELVEIQARTMIASPQR